MKIKINRVYFDSGNWWASVGNNEPLDIIISVDMMNKIKEGHVTEIEV